MIELPKSPIGDIIVDPKELVIIGTPKVGKTSAVLGLPNALLINLEKKDPPLPGQFISMYKEVLDDSNFNENQLSLSEDKKKLIILTQIVKKLQEAYKSGFQYDYIIIDTLTDLEDISNHYATALYKSTSIGANFDGKDVVAELKMGAGYLYLRKAFVKILSSFKGLAKKCLIFIVHPKLVSIDKKGVEVSLTDIDLTGKLKTIVAGNVDSIGLMTRNKDNTNQVILSFTSDEGYVSKGSNIARLDNKEFVISELVDGKLVYYWDQIFTNL